MTARPLAPAIEPAARSSIGLPVVDVLDVAAARLLRAAGLPAGLREELARAAHETLESLLPATAARAVTLSGVASRIDLAASQLAATAVGDDALEVARGRHGVRLARTGDAPVHRNGWLVDTGRPVALRDGDVVTTPHERYVARYQLALPRPLVEIGPARRANEPARRGFEFRFAIEPAGEPLVLCCDAASGRALLDVVCGGDGSRPFDPAPLCEVDHATVDWLVARFGQTAARALFGEGATLRLAPDSDARPEWWFACAVRVGAYHGVWWLGASGDAIRAAGRELRGRGPSDRAPRVALARVEVNLAARVDLGTVAVDELACVEAGDLFVARGGPSLVDGCVVGDGRLAVLGAECDPAGASFERGAAGLRARVSGFHVGARRYDMTNPSDRADGDAPFAPVLDGLGVTVSVEVARKRISLGDLLAVAPGDVVELDLTPSNAVSLLIDGSPFARGELVDVDGALGVRVLAVGGRQ